MPIHFSGIRYLYSQTVPILTTKRKSIPVRSMPKEIGQGIAVRKIATSSMVIDQELADSHRHDHHTFVLQESGYSFTEIDFEEQFITEPAIFYQSPNQVHRAIKIENIELYVMVIDTENLSADYLKVLQQLSPVRPLAISGADLALLQQTFALCTKLSEKLADQHYFPILRDSCNALVGLFISHYLQAAKPKEKYSRFEIVANAFTSLLEQHFISLKRPADYAAKLNISVPYLNECIREVTGCSVSHQIQERVILEAKRLLYHSNRSVKEISSELGYEDPAYFSRLFAKAAGITALQFRNKTTISPTPTPTAPL